MQNIAPRKKQIKKYMQTKKSEPKRVRFNINLFLILYFYVIIFLTQKGHDHRQVFKS
jgi:hypothetical protein